MPLHIQDPADPGLPTLHEQLLAAAYGAIRGAAVFSYATRDGVKLLLQDDAIAPLLQSGNFELIVGVDDVTDTRALNALEEVRRRFPALRLSAFVHELPDATFHPKFSWFGRRGSGTLIVGSGNLTGRGLRRNWEAFTTTSLDRDQLRQLRLHWEGWRESHSDMLLPLDDPRVLERARRNAARVRRPRAAEEEPQPPAGPLHEVPALIAEIPRGQARWNQANFDRATFTGFFGAQPGQLHRIVLQHVNPDGTLGELENRPAVSVASHNYRFELAPGRGLPYPDGGRPIGVFVRIAPRTFTYRLSMPGDPDYQCFSGLLDAQWNGPATRLRRVTTDTSSLIESCPDSPIWAALLNPED